MLVLTFAYYSFEDKDEDSNLKRPNIEYSRIWGKIEHTILGIQAHNDVIRNLADYNDFIFLDQEKLISNKDKEYFRDICHLTDKGSEVFVQNLLNKIKTLNLDK